MLFRANLMLAVSFVDELKGEAQFNTVPQQFFVNGG